MAHNIFNHLSKDILNDILSSYPSLEDISRLDIAVTNHAYRSIFLECLESEACAWTGEANLSMSSQQILWLHNEYRKSQLQ